MGSTWGTKCKISIFGESHGPAIGVVMDGLPAGLAIDYEDVLREMRRRAPGRDELSTPRKEEDIPRILSGIFEDKTTGAPLCAMIENRNTRSGDYANLKNRPRPGHADFTGFVRYNGFNDPRGGGHFSGRITAPLVFCGAIIKQILRQQGIVVGGHVAAIAGVQDDRFDPVNIQSNQLDALRRMALPLLNGAVESAMRSAVAEAKAEQDSVGGVIECAICGLPAGVGNPFFNSLESVLAHLLFSIPAIKGVEFGDGFGLSSMRGSQANDPYCMQGGSVRTTSNHNGGILGGITNGMPVIFRTAVKPTPSIGRQQSTVLLSERTETTIAIEGRHDPCIVQRALPVVEAAAALAVYELLTDRP